MKRPDPRATFIAFMLGFICTVSPQALRAGGLPADADGAPAQDPVAEFLGAQSLDDLQQALHLRSKHHAARIEGRPVLENALQLDDRTFSDVTHMELLNEVLRREKEIHGLSGDTRDAIRKVSDAAVLANAAASVALFGKYKLAEQDDGSFRLTVSQTLKEARKVCDREPFSDQLAVSDCSGFLIDSQTVITAGHCVMSEAMAHKLYFVFGYRSGADGKPPASYGPDDVYEAETLLGRRYDYDNADWAAVRLDREVVGHPPVRSFRKQGKIATDAPLYAIGHPFGVPLVYSHGARVRDNSPQDYFVSNLDVVGGSSGSMVVNAETHRVEGIVSRGPPHLVATPKGCFVSGVCRPGGCDDESSTRIRTLEACTACPSDTR